MSVQPQDGPVEQPRFSIGDIEVTADSVVTPSGTAPLRGSTWVVDDRSLTTMKRPAWAIVCAVVFTLACLFGLFFLMVRKPVTTGHTAVTVRSGELEHTVQIPVTSRDEVVAIREAVRRAEARAATPAP